MTASRSSSASSIGAPSLGTLPRGWSATTRRWARAFSLPIDDGADILVVAISSRLTVTR